jgi:serine/threonine protein kinase
MQLVHMDIKPGNIFISRDKRLYALNYDSADDGFEEDDPVSTEEEITYKIGNFYMRKVYITPLSSQLEGNVTYILIYRVYLKPTRFLNFIIKYCYL